MSGVRVRSGRGPLRRLWQWPLRSPVRAAATVAIVVAAVLVSATVARAPGPGVSSTVAASVTPTAAPQPRTSLPPLSRAPVTAGSGTGSPSSTAAGTTAPVADPAIGQVADSWTRAWLAVGNVDRAEWLRGLAPLTTEEYLGQLATVDPTRVPAGSVTGAVTITTRKAASAVVTVPTTVGDIRLSMIATATSWRVASADRR